MENKNEFELILCIVNKGYTVLRGRGSGNEEAEKLYGITITPEKELVMIVVPKAIKDAVLKEIYTEAGLDTRGQGIAFTMPEDDVGGISLPEEKKEENE